MDRALVRFLTTSAAYLALGEAYAAGVPEALRLIGRYTSLAGSPFNAVNLVTGLRTGQPVFLWQGEHGVCFASPTGPLGWSSVCRALDLVGMALTAQGLVRPSPQDLERALIGGTAAPGVLRLRSQGFGWARIAQCAVARSVTVRPGLRPLTGIRLA